MCFTVSRVDFASAILFVEAKHPKTEAKTMDKIHDCYAQSRVFQRTTDIFKEHSSHEVLFPVTKHSLHDAHRN
jgi:hypothetical protein